MTELEIIEQYDVHTEKDLLHALFRFIDMSALNESQAEAHKKMLGMLLHMMVEKAHHNGKEEGKKDAMGIR